MKKFFFVIVIFIIAVHIYGDDQELTLTFYDDTAKSFSIPSDITRIESFKMEFRVYRSDELVLIHKHRPSIVSISKLNNFENLKIVNLIYTFHGCNDIDFVISPSIEKMEISYGVSDVSLDFINKLENIKALRIHHFKNIDYSTIDISNTPLEYLEISACDIKTIENFIFNDELKYLNLGNHVDLDLTNEFIQELNDREITLIADEKPDGIENYIVTHSAWRVSYSIYDMGDM